jgi:multidrug resistance efflux pump
MAKPDPQLTILANLLNVEKEAREVKTTAEWAFVVANRSIQVINYDMSIVWMENGRIEAVSGVAVIERNAPFITWIEKLCSAIASSKRGNVIGPISASEVSKRFSVGWSEWLPPTVIWCPLIDRNGKLLGGWMLVASRTIDTGELGILKRLSDAYGHALAALMAYRRRPISMFSKTKSRWWWAGGAIITSMLLMLPVRESALAPGSVVARDLTVVSAPMDGVIERIDIGANEMVHAGQVLLHMDQTTVKNRHDVAVDALRVAEAELTRNSQMAFSDSVSGAKVGLSKAEILQRNTEVAFSARQLERIVIRSPANGVAIFGDQNDWLGRPVTVGERIMSIGDPDRVELEIWMPVANAIGLKNGSSVTIFLNVDPLAPINGELTSVAYEASNSPDGTFAYRLKAKIGGDIAPPRIGLRGTAKVYGGRVPLGYYLFRRPLSALRQTLGV